MEKHNNANEIIKQEIERLQVELEKCQSLWVAEKIVWEIEQLEECL